MIREIDFREKLKEIEKKGFIKSLRADNTGIGYTIETLLDIDENNSVIYDFKYGKLNIELKGKRIGTSSRVTLLTKSPTWNPLSANDIIKKYGKFDKRGRLSVKVTLSMKKFNSRNMMLDIGKNRINIIHKTDGILCYFDIEPLNNLMENKLSNLLLVWAERKISNEIEYFYYKEAYLFTNYIKNSLLKLLKESKIIWEFRMDLRKKNPNKDNLSVRDHGSGFRITPKFIDEIYQSKERVL